MKIENITRADIQKAIDDICKTDIGKPYAIIKNQSINVIKEGYKKDKSFWEFVGLARNTVYLVRQGKRIEVKTAEKICDALHIPLKKHFEVFDQTRRYRKYTVHGFFRILRTILGHAVQRGIMKYNPAYGNGVIKITAPESYSDVSEDKVFNYEEYKQFEAILLKNIKSIMEQYDTKMPRDDYYSIRSSIYLLIGIHTGLRNGELCGLQWNDIDLEKRKLRVVRNAVYTKHHGVFIGKPKSKTSIRTISISPLLTKQLQQYKKWWDRENEKFDVQERFLFIRNNGKLIHPTTPSGWLRKILRENGMKSMGMHGLRHTHATISIVHFRADIKTVSVRLGHSTVGLTLDVYTHFIPKGDEELADMWDA